jgi:hypothetical protein
MISRSLCGSCQVERLQLELASAREQISTRVAAAADGADAMLASAAGAHQISAGWQRLSAVRHVRV